MRKEKTKKTCLRLAGEDILTQDGRLPSGRQSKSWERDPERGTWGQSQVWSLIKLSVKAGKDI